MLCHWPKLHCWGWIAVLLNLIMVYIKNVLLGDTLKPVPVSKSSTEVHSWESYNLFHNQFGYKCMWNMFLHSHNPANPKRVPNLVAKNVVGFSGMYLSRGLEKQTLVQLWFNPGVSYDNFCTNNGIIGGTYQYPVSKLLQFLIFWM